MTPIEVLPEMTIAIPRIDILWPPVVAPKRICIDLDGVICEYDFPKMVKSFFGADISPAAIFAYDLADVLGVAPRMKNMMFKKQFWIAPRFIEDAIETLKQWMLLGYELAIYSRRAKYMGERGLTQWMVDHEIPFSGIDIDGSMEYDVHIDDSPGKLMATNSRVKLLYTQPWNKRCLNIEGRLKRVNNWREVRDNVSALL